MIRHAATVRPWLPALLLTLGVAPLHAESLEEAWQQAETQDHRLAAAVANVDGARATERAARGARLPQLSVSGGYTRFSVPPQLALSNGALPLHVPLLDGNDTSMATAQVQLALFTGGRISGGVSAARESVRAADDSERSERAALRLDVAEAYVGVLRSRRQSLSAESGVASLRAHVADVQNMVERELVARNDLLSARVALANAEQQRVATANGVALALAAYNRRLGQPMDRDAQLGDRLLPADASLAERPLEELVPRALAARPELAALDANASALAAQARAARGAMLPQIAISGSRTHLDTAVLDRKDFSYVGVGLTWNLFDGGQAWNQASALRSAGRAAEARRDDLGSQVELQVRQFWLGVREARARAAAARESVDQAEENLRVSRELYGAGLANNTQVLDAVTLDINARNNRDSALLDEQLAQVRLSYAVGAL
ncbi:MAG: TolC family protein [Casimicrobiaceae bacterium]